ncbi:hypothetical protein WG66_013624 [Moniliophthora roreri]|nr:hypothetical protein WG66_013624 [Moniliophthora roreri]
MSFNRCSNFTITAEQVSNVYGSQTNIRHLHGNLVLPAQQTRREQTKWDDYRHVQPCDVYLTRPLASDTQVERDEVHITEKQFRSQDGTTWEVKLVTHQRVAACRTISAACIFGGGRLGDTESPYVAQLFGYNDNQSGSLALIFYDALIPLSCVVFKNNELSPFLHTYFRHQLGLWQPRGSIDMGDLWINPRSGTLCIGPHVQIPSHEGSMLLSYPSNLTPNGHLPPLSIQTFSDTNTTFDYLTRTVPTLNIIRGITRCGSVFWKRMTDADAASILQTLPNTVYHFCSQKIIARVPVEVRDRIYYYLTGVYVISDAIRESLDVMEDGLVRVMPTDVQCVEGMTLQYFLSSANPFPHSWMTQAHRIFTQLCIDEDKWEEYGMHDAFCLLFKCKIQNSIPYETTSTTFKLGGAAPVYLFIRPIPQPSVNDKTWSSWAQGAKYFWSSDPFGKEEMSEAMQLPLALPSFTCEIVVCQQYWHQSAYDAIRMLHCYHYFDLSTTDLASSVGFPILEVVGDDNQFEACEDSVEMTSGFKGSAGMKRIMTFKTRPVKRKIIQCWQNWRKRMGLKEN